MSISERLARYLDMDPPSMSSSALGSSMDDSAVNPYRRPHAITDESVHGPAAEWKKKHAANKPRPVIDTDSMALRIKGNIFFRVKQTVMRDRYNVILRTILTGYCIALRIKVQSLKNSNLLQNCLVSVQDWMFTNKLKLNQDKTEFLLIGNKCHRNKFNKNSPSNFLALKFLLLHMPVTLR